MKKKILYIALLLICLSIITGGTYAYYTSQATARNVITTGGVEVKVVEQQLVNGTLQTYPNEPIRIMPTQKVSKVVSVQSVRQDSWIRATYTLAVFDGDNQQVEIPAADLQKAIVMDLNSTDWTQKDGWWYYNTSLEAGAVTVPLFREVTFSGPHMDNRYQNCTLVIEIIAQGVQKANNGTTVMEALGWPAA